MSLFAHVPSWLVQVVAAIARWAQHNPMTFVLLLTAGVTVSWVFLTLAYQARVRRNDQRRTADRRQPGSFPGNNR